MSATPNLAPGPPIALHRVTSPTDPAFQSLLDIYTEAHPPSERKPLSLLLAMLQRPEYLFEVITLSGAVAGFAIVLCFPNSGSSDACLLEYMAIKAGLRNAGLGSSLFRHITQLPQIAPRFLLAEVDSEHVPSPDRADRIRRKNFYRKLGCKEVEDLAYLMPPVSSSTPPAMNLMAYRLNLPADIAKDHLRSWLESIYRNVYHVPLPDPRIDEMLESLPRAPRLI